VKRRIDFDGGEHGRVELQALTRVRAHPARVELPLLDEVRVCPRARANVDVTGPQGQRLRTLGGAKCELFHSHFPGIHSTDASEMTLFRAVPIMNRACALRNRLACRSAPFHSPIISVP